MKLFTRTKFIGSIALVAATMTGAAAAAPQSSATPTPAPSTCDTATAPAPPPDTTEGAVPRDPALKLVADALSKVCLSDDQRAAAQQLGKEVAPKEEAVAEARHAFFKAVVDQIKSGTVDDAALKAQIDALVKAREDASPVMRKAIEDLHGILDSGQRAEFVDAIQSRMKELTGAASGWFQGFAKDLNLTDDQKSRIHDLLDKAKPQIDKERATAAAVFDAFKQDQFSVEAIAPMADVGPKTRARAEGMVALAKDITESLTPDQRATLASKIESKAADAAPTSGQGQAQQGLVAAHAGYHAGAVGGFGGGYRGGSVTAVRTGYGAGYPIAGGYSPGYF